jgi:hypothetical protein
MGQWATIWGDLGDLSVRSGGQLSPIIKKSYVLFYFPKPVYPQPPYVLFFAGFLASVSSGYAFSTALQQSVNEWNSRRSTRILATLRGPKLQIPFFGICAGVCVFLASGIQLFGFSAKVAYAMGMPMTLLSGLLIWSQLSRILTLIEEGGSKALDLDSF